LPLKVRRSSSTAFVMLVKNRSVQNNDANERLNNAGSSKKISASKV
jgi:hypothetical protein